MSGDEQNPAGEHPENGEETAEGGEAGSSLRHLADRTLAPRPKREKPEESAFLRDIRRAAPPPKPAEASATTDPATPASEPASPLGHPERPVSTLRFFSERKRVVDDGMPSPYIDDAPPSPAASPSAPGLVTPAPRHPASGGFRGEASSFLSGLRGSAMGKDAAIRKKPDASASTLRHLRRPPEK